MHTAPFWRRAVGARLSRVQRLLAAVFSLFLGTLLVVTLFASRQSDAQSFSSDHGNGDRDGRVSDYARHLLEEGRRAFRSDTFGDEKFWGDALKLHLAIAGAKLGGVGPGLSPVQALGLGLKIDVEALPGRVQAALRAGAIESERSGRHGCASGSRCGRRSEGLRGSAWRPEVRGDPVRAVPFDRRQQF